MERDNYQEGKTIYRATVTDTISHDQVGRFTFSADSEEDALVRGWRVAGCRFGSDIHVRIERVSK